MGAKNGKSHAEAAFVPPGYKLGDGPKAVEVPSDFKPTVLRARKAVKSKEKQPKARKTAR